MTRNSLIQTPPPRRNARAPLSREAAIEMPALETTRAVRLPGDLLAARLHRRARLPRTDLPTARRIFYKLPPRRRRLHPARARGPALLHEIARPLEMGAQEAGTGEPAGSPG